MNTVSSGQIMSPHTEEAALTEWLSLLECHSVHRKVVGLIPSPGTYLGFG